MIFEQSYYTCLEVEFETVSHSPGLVQNELFDLEEHSTYFLPASMYHDESVQEYPVRYLFYRLSSGGFVFARGTYAGTDKLGRVGNYLFHNLILKGTLEPSLNPISLLRYLIESGHFSETVSKDEIQPLEIQYQPKTPGKILSPKLKEQLAEVFYLLLNNSPFQLLVQAELNQILNLTDCLYEILDARSRQNIPFDSLGFGQSLNSPKSISGVYGIPPNEIFYDHHAIWKPEQVELTLHIPHEDPQGTSALIQACQVCLENNQSSELRKIAEFFYRIQTQGDRWEILLTLQPDMQKALFDSDSSSLVKEIISTTNTTALTSIAPFCSDANWHEILGNEHLLMSLADSDSPTTLDLAGSKIVKLNQHQRLFTHTALLAYYFKNVQEADQGIVDLRLLQILAEHQKQILPENALYYLRMLFRKTDQYPRQQFKGTYKLLKKLSYTEDEFGFYKELCYCLYKGKFTDDLFQFGAKWFQPGMCISLMEIFFSLSERKQKKAIKLAGSDLFQEIVKMAGESWVEQFETVNQST